MTTLRGRSDWPNAPERTSERNGPGSGCWLDRCTQAREERWRGGGEEEEEEREEREKRGKKKSRGKDKGKKREALTRDDGGGEEY